MMVDKCVKFKLQFKSDKLSMLNVVTVEYYTYMYIMYIHELWRDDIGRYISNVLIAYTVMC